MSDGTQTNIALNAGAAGGGAQLLLSNGTEDTINLDARAFGEGAQFELRDSNGTVAHQFTAYGREWKVFDTSVQERVCLTADSSGAELLLRDSTGAVSVKLDSNDNGSGRVTTDVLEITGADVAEKFPVSQNIEPGMVVAIDPHHPGQLCLAQGAYNRRVAGVVSGANGLYAGAVLGNQPGHDAVVPVALSGRVWVYCDASKHGIQPGDLLTTSDVPGHAMKVSDHARAQGAVIGKAMTRLAEGRGLVLVLVTLQ